MTRPELGTLIEIQDGARWNAQRCEHEIAGRMARFDRLGLAPGERVLIAFGNRAAFFAELLAVWRLGGCAIPVDPRLTPFELENLARAADVRFVVVDEHTDAAVLRRLEELGLPLIETTDVPGGSDVPAVENRPGDDALILFTSGSTGDPKGVVHTHGSLRARWDALAQHLGHEAYERTLCLLPTHFGHGLICNALFPFLSGQELYVAPPFRTELVGRLGKVIDQHEITFLSSVPSLWRVALRIAKPPEKGTLRRVHVGSAPLSAHLWRGVREWTGTEEVFNAYGITETGSWTAGTTCADGAPADGLIGEPWGAEVRVSLQRDTRQPLAADNDCAPGESGHVWLRTPALMRGYLDRDDLTAAVLRDGWFLTGDVGHLDEEGRLFLSGREREEINKGGTKIQPADVDAVAERFPGVRDVCTFAFEDSLYGQNVGIALVLEDGSDDVLRMLFAWTKKHLAEHARPVRWYLLHEIPRTSRGKVNRDSVRQTCDLLKPVDLAGVLRRSA
jgi:acyl-CoA synthetase (AMP-forming)/AMP-acid ligase II